MLFLIQNVLFTTIPVAILLYLNESLLQFLPPLPPPSFLSPPKPSTSPSSLFRFLSLSLKKNRKIIKCQTYFYNYSKDSKCYALISVVLQGRSGDLQKWIAMQNPILNANESTWCLSRSPQFQIFRQFQEHQGEGGCGRPRRK